MKLIRLSLKNFRQHADTVVEFRDGMTAIVGANGSGKTTLLDAILFVLYAQVPGSRVTELRTIGAESRQKVEVTLDFEFQGDRYSIRRTETDASLEKVVGDVRVTLAQGKSATEDTAQRLLKLTLDQFANSFCARQKEIGFFAGAERRDRQAEIARMLGYDRLKKAKKATEEDLKDLRSQIKVLEPIVNGAPDLQPALNQAKKDLEQEEGDLRERQNEYGAILAALPALEAAAHQAEKYRTLDAEMEALKQRGRDLKHALDTAKSAMALAKKQVADLAALAQPVERYVALEQESKELAMRRREHAEFSELRGRREAHVRQIAERKQRLEAVQLPDLGKAAAAVGQCIKARADAEAALNRVRDAANDARRAAVAEEAQAKEIHRAAEAALADALKLVEEGLCPTCRQPTDSTSFQDALRERERHLRETESRLEAARARFRQLEADPDELVAAKAALDAATNHHNQAQSRFDEAKRTHDARGEELAGIAEMESQLEELDMRLLAAPAAIDEGRARSLETWLSELKPVYERSLELRGAPAALERAQTEVAEATMGFEDAKRASDLLRAQLVQTGFETRDAAEAALTECKIAEERRKASAKRVADGTKNLEAVQLRIKDLEKQLGELEERRRDLHEKQATERLRKYVGDQLENLRIALNGQIRPELARLTGDNLALLTHGRYHAVELNEAFESMILDEGIAKPVISGGEQDVLALALRLALSELIQDRSGVRVSLLILDEVFGSLDGDRRQAVMERLDALKAHYSQIFVISHIDEINEVADQCLYVARDPESGIASVTDTPRGAIEADFSAVLL